LGEIRVVEAINGGDNSTNSKNTNPKKKAIHIHGGMEHNLVRYAKYYSYRCTKILGSSEFTREIYHSTRDFFRHW
jgi:hypothetical protein